ncbi:MAG: hypothetical protein QM831_36190 [Kofleriaceae bacterium]
MRFFLFLTLFGCAGPTTESSSSPRGPRADEHLAAARREDARANELVQWPQPTFGNPAGQDQPQFVWSGSWDTVQEHHRHAEEHRTAAARLEAEYEDACRDTPAEQVMTSPLQRYGIGGSATATGALVLLAPEAGPPERLLTAMRCHRAWMMLGRTDMDDCPLDVPGLRVTAKGQANEIQLELSVDDKKWIPELQRRAAHDLEMASQHLHQEAP